MKAVKFIVLLICLQSCSDPEEQMQLFIQNQTQDTLRIQLFPDSVFQHGEGWYKSKNTSGSYEETEFILNPARKQSLFISTVTDRNPAKLLGGLFDSITIFPVGNTLPLIHFQPDSAIGYATNPYESEANWNLEHNTYKFHTNFSTQKTESDDYIFVVSPEKIQ